MADRATQPRRHALRILESASVRAKLTRIPPARGSTEADVKRWVQLLERAGALRRADDTRRFPRAHGRPGVRLAPGSERARRRTTSTTASRLACARGASSARGRTAFPRTSSCTTRRCRSWQPSSRRPTASSRVSKGSGRSSSSATRRTCSPSWARRRLAVAWPTRTDPADPGPSASAPPGSDGDALRSRRRNAQGSRRRAARR